MKRQTNFNATFVDRSRTTQVPLMVQVTITREDGIQRSLECQIPYDAISNQIRINEIFSIFQQRGIISYGNQLFYIDYVNRVNQYLGLWPFQQEATLKIDRSNCKNLQFGVRKSEFSEMINETQQNGQNMKGKSQKNKKVKERTIGEAVDAVRNWRILYDTPDQNGKRLYTLDEAALRVGIAKKSLDDYYNNLRIAMQFNFNFDRFREQKIGLLRRFIKVAKQEGEIKLRQKFSECILDENIQIYWQNMENV